MQEVEGNVSTSDAHIVKMLQDFRSKTEKANWLDMGDDIYTPLDVAAVLVKVRELRNEKMEQHRLVDAIALAHAVQLLEQLRGMLQRQERDRHLREVLDEPQTLMPVVSQEEYDAHLARGSDLAANDPANDDLFEDNNKRPAISSFDPFDVTDEHEKDAQVTEVLPRPGLSVEEASETQLVKLPHSYAGPYRPIRDNPQA